MSNLCAALYALFYCGAARCSVDPTVFAAHGGRQELLDVRVRSGGSGLRRIRVRDSRHWKR